MSPGYFTSPNLKPAKSIYVEINRIRKKSITNYEVIVTNVLHNVVYSVGDRTIFKVETFQLALLKVGLVLKNFPNEFINLRYNDNL